MGLRQFKNYLSFVKFSHTIFALPFAVIGFFLATQQPGYDFSWYLLLLVLLCMLFARSAAMGFNRWADRKIDKKNPRTEQREIPRGAISPGAALTFVILSSVAFILCTWFINFLCFCLSPLALLVILGYSYTKRFTSLSHFVLGLGLSLAPIGAYLAVTGRFDVLPLLYSGLVFFWVAGFDIIYALQDKDFDKQEGLRSIPARLSVKNSLITSAISHLFSVALLITAVILGESSWIYLIGCSLFIMLLLYQHLIVKPSDLSRINQAFALVNGFAGVLLALFFVMELVF
jgi:4-hydroxybenzoate polyprenyltransferase